jgi:phage baseplate assembly protein W
MAAESGQSNLSVFYKDFNLGLQAHPVTGALMMVKNADAVKQGVRNLIMTNHFERPYRSKYGGNIRQHLFDLFDSGTVEDVKADIGYCFKSYMRRAELIAVNVKASEDTNFLYIEIYFRPINQVNTEQVDIKLERLR